MAYIKELEAFLKSFDLFGETFTFKIKKRKYYTSLLGGVTSFTFIVYSLYYLFFNLTDFFKKNIRSSENDIKITNQNFAKIKDHQYMIFFFCLRDNKMKINEYLLKNFDINSAYINNYYQNSIFNSSSTPLKMNFCTKQEIDDTFSKHYTFRDFSMCKCLNFTSDQNHTKELEIKSFNNFVDRSFINIKLEKNLDIHNISRLSLKDQIEINNTDYTNHNDNNEDVDEYLNINDNNLYVHFPSYYIDAKNLSEPLKKNINTEIFKIKPETSIETRIDFSLINFRDYSSLYDDDSFNKITKFQFEKKEMLTYYKKSSTKNNIYININLGLSTKIINHDRTVLRYDDFLGNLVGYLSNIIIILYLFNTIYNSFRAEVYFSEKFFMKNNNFQKKILEELNKKINSVKPPNSSQNFSVGINNEIIESNHDKNLIAENNTNKFSSNNDIPNEFEIEMKDNKMNSISLEKEQLTEKNNQNNDKINKEKIINFQINYSTPNDNGTIKEFAIDQNQTEKKHKKNSFKYNYFEFIYHKLFCCFPKKKNIIRKHNILTNTKDFSDYYLDINIYIKNMIELDMIKKIIFNDNKNLIYLLENFKPCLKEDYSEKYNNKLCKLYSNKLQEQEIESYLNSINYHSSSEDFLQELKRFYE